MYDIKYIIHDVSCECIVIDSDQLSLDSASMGQFITDINKFSILVLLMCIIIILLCKAGVRLCLDLEVMPANRVYDYEIAISISVIIIINILNICREDFVLFIFRILLGNLFSRVKRSRQRQNFHKRSISKRRRKSKYILFLL